jgi:hypothetical protein
MSTVSLLPWLYSQNANLAHRQTLKSRAKKPIFEEEEIKRVYQ